MTYRTEDIYGTMNKKYLHKILTLVGYGYSGTVIAKMGNDVIINMREAKFYFFHLNENILFITTLEKWISFNYNAKTINIYKYIQYNSIQKNIHCIKFKKKSQLLIIHCLI